MHPILAGRGPAAIYLAAWAVIGLFLTALLVVAHVFPWGPAAAVIFPMMLVYAFVNLSSFFLCRAMPLGGTGFTTLLVSFLAVALISSSVWVTLGVGWSWILQEVAGFPQMLDRYSGQVPTLFTAGVLLFLLVAGVHYVIIASEVVRENERRAFELRLQAQEAELKLLRAQIDPHFLFNSLNSISALISSAPQDAREMSLRLAGFLRESLRLSGLERIPLGEEVALIGDFLAIEQTRFGPRLRVETEVDPAALSCAVPPLILQPLVENAVRHGIAHLVEGGTITLRAARSPAALTIVIGNPCDPDRPRRRGTGIGLDNVRRRLRASYGSDAWVDVEETDTYVRVSLTLPPSERT